MDLPVLPSRGITRAEVLRQELKAVGLEARVAAAERVGQNLEQDPRLPDGGLWRSP